MRRQLIFHFDKDFPSATKEDRKQLLGAFDKFYAENQKWIEDKIAEKKPKEEIPTEKLDYVTQFDQIVQKIKESYHVLTMADKSEEMLFWENVYHLNGEQKIKGALQKIVKDCTTQKVNELLNAIRRETFISRDILVDSLKLDSLEPLTNPHLALKTNLINLDTLEFEPFNPNYYLLNQLQVSYDENCDYHNSLFWTFINQVLPEDDVNLLQEIVGAMLVKNYLTKKFAIFEGPRNTGKTTTLKIIIALLGKKNVSTISLQRLGKGDKFTLGPMYGKMANIRDELPIDLVRGIDQLKELTGRSMVQAERKFGAEFEFVNYAFMLFACNNLPPIKDDDMAFWDRVIMIKFRRTFGGQKRDATLEKKLTEPKELSAVLSWALEGLKRLKANDWNFSKTETAEKVRDDYRRQSSPLEYFMIDECEQTDEDADYIIKDDFHTRFKKRCEDLGISIWPRAKIGAYIQSIPNFDIKSDRVKIDQKSYRVWKGIKWKGNDEQKQLLNPDSTSSLKWQGGDFVPRSLEREAPHEETIGVQSGLPPVLGQRSETFTHIEPSQLGFGGDCELCGKRSVATYLSSEGYLACKDCAKGEGEIPKS
jgi:putative DNA primase/helicase